MMHGTAPVLVSILMVACATASIEEVAPVQPSGWSAPTDQLSVRLQSAAEKVLPEGVLSVGLFVRASAPIEKHSRLLQGQFVFTFVPMWLSKASTSLSSRQSFSGGGGIDYTGQLPLEFLIEAPRDLGHYLLFATTISTDADIKYFLMTARMSASAGPWWTGTLSTPAVAIEVIPEMASESEGTQHLLR
jgi:hypothetical protein